jgi:hypothetical protein
MITVDSIVVLSDPPRERRLGEVIILSHWHDATIRGWTHLAEFYAPECVEGVFPEVRLAVWVKKWPYPDRDRVSNKCVTPVESDRPSCRE